MDWVASERKIFFRNLKIFIPIGLWTLIVYKDIYKVRFFLDDYLHIHLIRAINNLLVPFGKDLMMGAFYRPGVFFLWKLNYLLSGMNPVSYYALNMVILLLTALLLMQVMQHLTGNKGVSGYAALFFAISPVTATGVLWLSNRFDLLGTFFFMWSLLLFLRYLRFRRKRDITWSMLIGFYSFFCKEIAITLPAVLIMSGLFMFYYRGELTKSTVRRILILSLPYLVAAAAFMMWRYAILGTMGGYSGEERVPLKIGYIAKLVSSFGSYVWLFSSLWIFLAVAIVLLSLYLKRHFFMRNPIALYGLLFAFITATPLAMVLQAEKVMTYQTPRFFFLPGVGLAVFLAAAYDPRSGRLRRIIAGVVLVAMVLLSSANTFLITYNTKEKTQRAEKQMTKIHEFLKEELPKSDGTIVFACMRGLDVALDSAIKAFYPEYLKESFIVNCASGTQVIAKEDLYKLRGGDLTFPKTFNKNPNQFNDLYYGVVSATPKEILDALSKKERTYALYKNKEGRLTWVTREYLRSQMETMGASIE
jgi:hypothetical protein